MFGSARICSRLQEYRGYEVLSCTLDSARRRHVAIEAQPESFLQQAWQELARSSASAKPSRSQQQNLSVPRNQHPKPLPEFALPRFQSLFIQGMSMDAARLLDHRSEADLKAQGLRLCGL